jgi:hypothetical protein
MLAFSKKQLRESVPSRLSGGVVLNVWSIIFTHGLLNHVQGGGVELAINHFPMSQFF